MSVYGLVMAFISLHTGIDPRHPVLCSFLIIAVSHYVPFSIYYFIHSMHKISKLTNFIEIVVNSLSCHLVLMIFTLLGWFIFGNFDGSIINGLLSIHMTFYLFSLYAGGLPGVFGNIQVPFYATHPAPIGMYPNGPTPPGGGGPPPTFVIPPAHASSNNDSSNDVFGSNSANPDTIQTQTTGNSAIDRATHDMLNNSLGNRKSELQSYLDAYRASGLSLQGLNDMEASYYEVRNAEKKATQFVHSLGSIGGGYQPFRINRTATSALLYQATKVFGDNGIIVRV